LRWRARSPLWRNTDFLLLWSAQTISQFGTQITGLALPLVAILLLDASAFEVAALGVAEFLPFVLLSLPAGVWVDRLPRRPILILADWWRGAVLLTVPAAHFAGVLSIWQLYVVGFLVGVGTVFFDVAYQSCLPALVQREELLEGNSKLEVTRSGAQVAGPGLAGVLVAAITAPYAILIDAVSFVVSALFISGIRPREERIEAEPELATPKPRMRTEIADGLRYVLRHPYLRPSMVYVATSNFFSTLMFAIFLVYAIRDVGLSPAMVGLIFSLGNIGFLVAALMANRLATTFGIGRTMIAAAALTGWPFLLVPLAESWKPIPLLFIALSLGAFGGVTYNIVGISLMQAITPDRLLGRMNASRRFIVWGVVPFGSLTGGALGSLIGLRPALWIGAVGASIAFLPLLFSPLRSLVETPQA
jgi:MFS family permease